jgi:hypothetical protein
MGSKTGFSLSLGWREDTVAVVPWGADLPMVEHAFELLSRGVEYA